MSNQSNLHLPYKIISSSSQSPDFPIANLTTHNQVWQSSRFCTFPQQITLKFQKPYHINKIQFLSHRFMIPNRIEILYLNNQGREKDKESGNLFQKYGYVRFSSNQETNYSAREQKTLDVDFVCNHLRLLLHKPFENKMNFFSQVGLEEILVFNDSNLRVLESSSEYHSISQSANKQSSLPNLNAIFEEQYINNKIKLLEQKKQIAVTEQRYDDAQKIKDIISNIFQVSEQIQFMIVKKQKAVELENYDEAKKIKNEIERIKKSAQNIIKNYLDGNYNQDVLKEKQKHGSFENNNSSRFKSYDKNQNENKSEAEIEEEIDQDRQDLNQFVEEIDQLSQDNQQREKQSRKQKQSRKGKESKAMLQSYQQQIPYHRQIINYDQRVIPAILNKNKPQPQDQFQTKLPQQPEQLDSKSVKQQQISSVFGEDTTRRFFSKYWQFRLEALTIITEQLQVPNATKDKNVQLRNSCYLKIILDGIKSNVFQICHISLQLFSNFINNKTVEHIKNEIEYDNILYEITKRLSDGNLKIRGLTQDLFKTMAKLPLYGVGICSSMLIKTVTPNSKLSNLQIQQRLDFLILFINEYGLGQGNVPISSVQFASGYVYYQYKQIRNSAIDLLVVCYLAGATGEEKVRVALEKLRKETSEEIYKKINEVEKSRESQKPKESTKNKEKQKQKEKQKGKEKEKEKQKTKTQSQNEKKMSQSLAQKAKSKPKPKPTKDKTK